MKQNFILTAIAVCSMCFAAPMGAVNTGVTQDNIHTTICKEGWTKTIRPSVSYTNKLKVKQLADPAYTDKEPSHYEEDHLISLELGGHPTSPDNLWPQPYAGEWGARKKDVVETRLKHLVCTGRITLVEAQQAIAGNWVAAYHKYVELSK